MELVVWPVDFRITWLGGQVKILEKILLFISNNKLIFMETG